MKQITQQVAKMAAPVAAQYGCSIWNVEYVKEAGVFYLRIYLDHPEGVSIDSCEGVSRAVSDWLDEADPIEGSYTLEVSSAGAERALKRPSDFQRFLGSEVTVRLYRPKGGKKEWTGILSGYEDGAVLLTADGSGMRFEKNEIAKVHLYVAW